MAKRALIFQHMEEDGPGRFGDLLAGDGFACETFHVDRNGAIPSLANYDLLLVLGGAMDTWQTKEHPWLIGEKQAIAEWVGERAKPYIGICLGHQLVADALGGEVGMADPSEIGLHTVSFKEEHNHPFLERLSGTSHVLQWHHAQVLRPPEDAVVLASSVATEIQALAIGNHALSVQFHFEWTLDWMRNWPQSWHDALRRERADTSHAQLIADATPHMPEFAAMAEAMYDNFMAVNGLK